MSNPNKELRQVRFSRGEIPRLDHCSFPKLNRSGKCIADCHYNLETDRECDCIGGTGEEDEAGRHEVRIPGNSGGLDGRNYFAPVHHPNGSYSITHTGRVTIPEPAKPVYNETIPGPGDTAYGWGTYMQPDGKVYQVKTRPDGSKYKLYTV